MFGNEIFSGLTAIPPVYVRLDGRAFHAMTRESGFKKPFDEDFMNIMTSVASSLISESGLEPVFAYVFSDEISLYFSNLPFGGRVEKIDSVCASYAAEGGMEKPHQRLLPVCADLRRNVLAQCRRSPERDEVRGYARDDV